MLPGLDIVPMCSLEDLALNGHLADCTNTTTTTFKAHFGYLGKASSFTEAHTAANLPNEGLLQVPLTCQATCRFSEHGRRDTTSLDGATEHEDGIAEGAFLGHDLVQLVADCGRGNEEIVDGGRPLRLAVGDDLIGLLERGLQNGRVGGQEGR